MYQGENAECALACVSMVLAAFGHTIDLAQLREAHAPSLRGTSLGSLLEILKARDLSPRVLKAAPENLHQLQTPAILHWDLSHYVVLVKVRKHYALIHDPNRGRVRVATGEISRRLSGLAIEVKPTEAFCPRNEGRAVLLRDVIVGGHRLIPSAGGLIAVAVVAQLLALLAPFYFQVAIDEAINPNGRSLLVTLTGFFFSIALLEWYMREVRNTVALQLGTRLSEAMSTQLLSRMLRLPAAYFESRSVSGVTAKFDSLEEIRTLITTDALRLLIDVGMSIGMLAVMLFYAPSLVPWTLACVVAYVIYRVATFEGFRYATEEQIARKTEQRTHLLQSVQNAAFIRVSGAERARIDEWAELLRAELRGEYLIGAARARYENARDLVTSAEMLVAGALCFSLVAGGSMSLGAAIAYFTYKRVFVVSALGVAETLFKARALRVQLSHLADVVHSPDSPVAGVATDLPEALPLRCQKVSFRYRGAPEPVLCDLTFSVERGQSWAIVGPSGVGKTSLLRLLLKLEVPSSGMISAGTHSLSDIANEAWSARVAVVFQGNTLFTGSIRENIAFGCGPIDDERLMRAAQLACIEAEIAALPMGFETRLEDRGGQLSAGQVQRVLIARALYRNPEILFLDEGTANLDQKTEQAVLANLEGLGITIVHAAHRAAIAARATHILELGNGTHTVRENRSRPGGLDAARDDAVLA